MVLFPTATMRKREGTLSESVEITLSLTQPPPKIIEARFACKKKDREKT
jgi:hypothetical protein